MTRKRSYINALAGGDDTPQKELRTSLWERYRGYGLVTRVERVSQSNAVQADLGAGQLSFQVTRPQMVLEMAKEQDAIPGEQEKGEGGELSQNSGNLGKEQSLRFVRNGF